MTAQQREQFWKLRPAGMTNGDLVLTAVEEHQQQLAAHFAPQQRLFVMNHRNRAAISPDPNEPRVAYSAQISQPNLAIIDRLCGDLGVSRSAYLAAALKMHAEHSASLPGEQS